MKNKLMLIGLSAMLSVGMSYATPATDAMDQKIAQDNARNEATLRARHEEIQKAKKAAQTIVTTSAIDSKSVPVTPITPSVESAATAKMLFDAELAEQKQNMEAGVEDTSLLKRSKNFMYRSGQNIVSAKDSIVHGVMNPSETASNAYQGAQSFGTYALDSAYKTGNSVYGNTFGKDLGYFNHDGAVASTVVAAGLIGAGVVVYKKGYVSKLKKALFGKMNIAKAKLTPVAKTTPVVLAPRKFIR